MAGVSIEVDAKSLDDLIAATVELAGEMGSDEMKFAMGTAMKETIRDHFGEIAQDSEHHQSALSLGATPTGFYEEARDKTQDPQIKAEGVSVSIDQEGLAQRYFGGDIEARPGGFLTIPARGEAYGKRAGDFPNLKLIIFPSGLAALVDRDEPKDEGGVYYWLVRSVHQNADPDILPTDDELTDSALESGTSYLDSIWQRQLA